MFSLENEENTEWKRVDSYDMQQFEDLRQRFHELSNKYQSKLSVEKDNLVEIEELRCFLENEREERKKENLRHEDESRKKEIQWKNEIECVRAENEDTMKMYKNKIETLEEDLAVVKQSLEKERKKVAEMKSHVEYLTEAVELEASKVKEAEMARNEQQQECCVLKEKLSTAEERLMIKEEEVENLKEKLEYMDSQVDSAINFGKEVPGLILGGWNDVDTASKNIRKLPEFIVTRFSVLSSMQKRLARSKAMH